VPVDRVAFDRVLVRGCRRRVDGDPGPAVEGDRVAGPGRGAADRDPGAAVADGGASARVRADVVPLDQVVRRLKGEEALDVHAAAGVTGDHVACTGGRASDRVPVREVDEDSRAVAKGGAAGGIRADVVALDEVAARAAQTDADARV